MRHAGMHWPTMAERPNRQAITSLPGVQNGVLVILADSARFHYDAIRQEAPSRVVVWRGLPRYRADARPASAQAPERDRSDPGVTEVGLR